MGKTSSKIVEVLSRLVKAVMVALLIPLAIGLLSGILAQLDLPSFSKATFRQWIGWGFTTYVGVHLLLYRPTALFQVSHRLFSVLAVWCFGGQVSSVEPAQSNAGSGKAKGGKGAKGDPAAQGSTLVAFSPFVIPLPVMLVCAAGWLAAHWVDRSLLDGPVGLLIGLAIAFQWIMTADALQQQRARWHVETYLLAIGLVFVLTLVLGGACLPWAIPEFSFVRALADGLSQTQEIYATLIRRIFL